MKNFTKIIGSWDFKRIKPLSYNILLAILLLCICIGLDLSVRAFYPKMAFFIDPKAYKLIFGTMLLAFLRYDLSILLIEAFFLMMIFFELVHYQYYNSWIHPAEISQFFSQFFDVAAVLPDLTHFFIFPIVLVIAVLVLIFLSLKLCRQRVRVSYAWLVVGLALFSMPFNIIALGKDNYNSYRPSELSNLYKLSYKLLAYYFAKQLPDDVFKRGSKTFAQPVQSPYPIRVANPQVNIILVLGESLTYEHMSCFGYQRQTTPFLNFLKNNQQVAFHKGISGAVKTDISLPYFFNMVPRPDGLSQILSVNTNLFKMAQQNGFVTSFISAQSTVDLHQIRGMLRLSYINTFLDSHSFGKNYVTSAMDDVLVDYLKNHLDFTRPNFLVLHQFGSHSPYTERYPAEFNRYHQGVKDFQTRQIDSYDNSVLYTDHIWQQIYQILAEKTNRPTYVIFTSDHGESLGEHHDGYGHFNYRAAQQYHVPILIAGLHGADMDFIKQNSSQQAINSTFMSHHQLSKLIAHLMGYSSSNIFNQASGYYVDGDQANGNSGFTHLSFLQKGKIKIDYFHP